MKNVEPHKHSFNKQQWPFSFDENVAVVTTKFVMNEGHPIVEVLHWEDGDWQFMCNTTDDAEDGMVVCMGCLYEKFPWVSAFKDLKRGFLSFFDEEENRWITAEIEET